MWGAIDSFDDSGYLFGIPQDILRICGAEHLNGLYLHILLDLTE